MELKSIILAAGKGTRMKSDLSKVLHEIFNKPILAYVLEALNTISSENFVIVGHQAEAVENFVKNNYENSKCILQTPQLGTGHAVSMAGESLKSFNGQVLVLCGDTPLITSTSLEKFIKFHNSKDSDLTVMSAVMENPTNYGRIVKNTDGSLHSIVEEKDATSAQKKINEVNAGIYLLNWGKVKSFFSELKNNNAQGEYYLTDIVSMGVEKNLNVNSFIIENNEEVFGINSKLHLAEATRILNNRNAKKHMENGVTIVDPQSVWISSETEIGADTIIYPNCYITGKNIIGSHCKIGPFAHLRGDVELGDYVKVGNFVEVKKSKIKSHTNVSHLSYIGDSELGEHVNIGAGTITANYNPITKVKSRTIIKDGANTGSNSVLVAPLTLNKNVNIGAGSVITKDINSNALALTRSPIRVIENWVKD